MTKQSPNHSHNNSLGAANVRLLAIIGTAITMIGIIVGIIPDGGTIFGWFIPSSTKTPDDDSTPVVKPSQTIESPTTTNSPPSTPSPTQKAASTPNPIFTTTNFTLVRTLTGHTDNVNSVAISPDGQNIVSGGSDDTIRVWSAR